jgi:glyoxylase I family protein
VGLNVADVDAAARWYTKAFGYERELTLRLEQVELDIVMLIHRERGDRLELLHRPGSAPGRRADSAPEAALTHGFGHVCFDVADLDAEYGRLVALGARPVMSPRPSPEAGVRMSFVADPEGNLVEIIERPRADS